MSNHTNVKFQILNKKWDLTHLLLPLIFVAAIMVFSFNSQPILQFEIIVLANILYVSLAFLHHYFDKSLTLEVVIEYILIAVLAISILRGLLL